jgi:hypothetical protein
VAAGECFGSDFVLYLAGIQGLAPKDTLCSDLEVRRVGIDDNGTLPT